MFRFAPYVLKSLWRHRARTLLTVSGSAAALFVFAFVQAARTGLDDMTRGARAERTLIVYQANRYCPFSSRLPEDYAGAIEKVSGVRTVVPIQVYVNNCKASLDTVLFHGIPEDKLGQARDIHFPAGAREAFEGRSDAALAGEALARRRGLSPGDRFTIGGISVTIAGVFTAPSAAEENVLYTRLPFLQQAVGGTGLNVVTQFEVHLDDAADPETVSRAIDLGFRGDRTATDTRPMGMFQVSVMADLAELIRWSSFLGYACVALVLALVATTTLMAVQDRAVEHAVLQAIGFSGPRIFGLVLSEGMLLSLAGGLFGIGAAVVMLLVYPIALSTEGAVLALTSSPSLALEGTLVSLVVGLVAGTIPAWQAARADIVPALRQG